MFLYLYILYGYPMGRLNFPLGTYTPPPRYFKYPTYLGCCSSEVGGKYEIGCA